MQPQWPNRHRKPHSENPECCRDAGLQWVRDILQLRAQKYGRYLHRNKILGRVPSEEEIEFLKQPGSGF